MSIFRENEQLYKLLSDFYQCLAGTPKFQKVQQGIDQFMEFDAARDCYEQLMTLEEELHHKQHDGNITEEDLARYREVSDRLQQMPLAEEFFSAQQEMEEINIQIANFIGIAIENGEIPTLDDLDEAEDAGCGCGCH